MLSSKGTQATQLLMIAGGPIISVRGNNGRSARCEAFRGSRRPKH